MCEDVWRGPDSVLKNRLAEARCCVSRDEHYSGKLWIEPLLQLPSAVVGRIFRKVEFGQYAKEVCISCIHLPQIEITIVL